MQNFGDILKKKNENEKKKNKTKEAVLCAVSRVI